MQPERYPTHPTGTRNLTAPPEPNHVPATLEPAAGPNPDPASPTAPDTLVRRVYSRPAGDLPATCPLGLCEAESSARRL